MKLSQETIEILQNLASINPNLVVTAGSRLTSVSESKSIIADVEIEEEFPVSFGIYELNEFLATLQLVENPELNFGEKFVTIKNETTSVRYFYSDTSVLTAAPSISAIEEKVGESVVDFVLCRDVIKQLGNATNILKMKSVSFTGNDGKVTASIVDPSDPTSNSFSVEVGEYEGDDFEFTAKYSNLKFIQGDYKVEFMNKNIPIGRFTNLDDVKHVSYFVAFER